MTVPIVNNDDNEPIPQTIKTDKGRPRMSADWWFDVANKAALIFLALGLAAAVIIYATSVRKEQRSNEEIATLTHDTALANEEVVRLKVELTKEQNERLKLLEAVKARNLTLPEVKALAESINKWHVRKVFTLYVVPDADASQFAQTIETALINGGANFRLGTLPPEYHKTVGVQLYENPYGGEAGPAGTLLNALAEPQIPAIGPLNLLIGQEPLPNLSSPALIIGLKAPFNAEAPAFFKVPLKRPDDENASDKK